MNKQTMAEPRVSDRRVWTMMLVILPSVLASCGEGVNTEKWLTPPQMSVNTGGEAGHSPATGGVSSKGAGGEGNNLSPSSADDCLVADPRIVDAESDELFNTLQVPTFDFFLAAEDWIALKDNAREELYQEVEGCFEGRRIGTAGLRFKGSYGSLYSCFDEQGQLTCPRLSLKVKFNEFESEQRLFGLKRLNFHTYRYDDSRLKERLVFDLYRSMGIFAPRVSWAVVRVNGESQGLYGMVEQIDGRFTADRWPSSPDGNLYKEIWPSWPNSTEVQEGLKTNKKVGDVQEMLGFIQKVNDAAPMGVRDVLSAHLDLERFAKFQAVDDAVIGYDNISYFWTDGINWKNHNFYVYEASAGRFSFIPWDVESSFWINPDHATPHWTQMPEDCDLTYPYWEGEAIAPACDPVMGALRSDLSAWRRAAQELLDGSFSTEVMLAAINKHAAFIGDEMLVDQTPWAYAPFEDAVQGLRRDVPAMRQRLQDLMEASLE